MTLSRVACCSSRGPRVVGNSTPTHPTPAKLRVFNAFLKSRVIFNVSFTNSFFFNVKCPSYRQLTYGPPAYFKLCKVLHVQSKVLATNF